MRKAAGIILIALGVLFISLLIYTVVGLGITTYRLPFDGTIEGLWTGVFIIVLAVTAAFHIAGGIFCLWKEYWRVCLASASFAVLYSVFYSGVSLLGRGAWLLNGNILMSLIPWVMLVAAVIATIFIAVRRKEWQAISDSVDSKVSKGG